MHRLATLFALATAVLSGCAFRPSSEVREVHGNAPTQMNNADYEAITRRILTRVVALKNIYPILENIREPQIADGGLATLEFEHGVTSVLDDPTRPASKLNGRRENYDKNGFRIRLHFYRGPWQGAAAFIPVEFADLKLWYSWDYRPGDDPAVIAAVAKIIDDEKKAFDIANTQ
jgi:hypothetical protein